MRRRQFLDRSGTVAVAASLFGIGLPSAAGQTQKSDATMKIQRLAWAGVKVVVGETTLFVDAAAAPNLTLGADTRHRYAVVTHHHGDHCDPEALKPVFTDRSYMVCYSESVPLFDPKGVRVQAANLYEPVFLTRTGGELVLIPVPASDGFGSPQVSWVVDGGGRRILHCGDTAWHGHWWDIGRAYGPFDLAFLPINGFRQIGGRYTDSGVPMGLTPEQAVAAARVLGARTVCPIHYGDPSEGYVEVPDPEGTFLKAARASDVKTVVVKTGEWLP